jgi:hypothetical protein
MGGGADANIQRFGTDDVPPKPIDHGNIDDQAGVHNFIANELISHLQQLP